MASLGAKIASLRKARGITQEYLAEKCSVSPQAVSKWENDITSPDISLLPRLSELLGVTCDELLGVQRAEVVAVDKDTVDLTKLTLKIIIKSSDGDKVNFNLPLNAAEPLLNSDNFITNEKDGKNVLKGIDFKHILSLVGEGAIGKLIDIESNDGDTVEIWVE